MLRRRFTGVYLATLACAVAASSACDCLVCDDGSEVQDQSTNKPSPGEPAFNCAGTVHTSYKGKPMDLFTCNVTQGEHPKIVFAAQRIMPCFHQGGASELNVPLQTVCFEIDGVNLLVTESAAAAASSSSGRAAVKFAAADTSVPAILAERVLQWLPEADAAALGAENGTGSKKGKRPRGQEDASNLTPSRIPPSAKRRRK